MATKTKDNWKSWNEFLGIEKVKTCKGKSCSIKGAES